MARIVSVCGTDGLREYIRKYKINLPTQIAKRIKPTVPIPFEAFINRKNQHRTTHNALDLLEKMLVYDKNGRITPREALKHPYFNKIRKLQNGETNVEDDDGDDNEAPASGYK